MSQSTNKRPIISVENPKSPACEAYRILRTNIEFTAFDHAEKVLLVTSSGPAEGKSTTAANLAVVYAQSDKRVLIIDADMRKPTMHHIFYKSNRIGLSNVLIGQYRWEDVVQNTTIDKLDILPSGPVSPNPSELLSNKRMSALVEEARKSYDIIIFDAPPVLPVTDPQILSTLCQGVIFVVHSGKAKKEAVRKAKESLERVEARLLGVVLNNVNRSSKDSYYYYYGN